MSQATYKAGQIPIGFQQLTVSDTVIDLIVPAGAVRAVFNVEAQPLRYRIDGSYPTGDVGVLVKADVNFEIEGNIALKAFRAIRDGGTDAILNVHYFGDFGTVVFETTTPTPTTTTTPSPTTTTVA